MSCMRRDPPCAICKKYPSSKANNSGHADECVVVVVPELRDLVRVQQAQIAELREELDRLTAFTWSPDGPGYAFAKKHYKRCLDPPTDSDSDSDTEGATKYAADAMSD